MTLFEEEGVTHPLIRKIKVEVVVVLVAVIVLVVMMGVVVVHYHLYSSYSLLEEGVVVVPVLSTYQYLYLHI